MLNLSDSYDSDSQSFKYKGKITRKTKVRPAQPPQYPVQTLNTEINTPLKYFGNFCLSFNLPLINCELEFDLLWVKDSVLVEYNTNITSIGFKIASIILYPSVVPLPIDHNIQFLENLKQQFKRTVSWNKYWSGIITQPKINNLDYLIDPTLKNFNK